ncbi:hypothetical protein RYZ26_05960 [Terasakiella sp. A23]|uniref:hypothetical protein n=1 Tax=Terasakiella sp. FCG-A23 TaxID=3080561 RepID=UPI002954247D|nr:hypothetical protein [Terasakiella sp. A23]MDV7339127.1 hypothetical protein [Terasakiella sp. A23]
MSHKSNKDAEQIFKALSAFDEVIHPKEEVPSKVAFSELYAYATNPAHDASPALKAALSTDFSLHRDLRRLLEKQAIVHMPRAAAASSGEISQREADGFKLTLKPSKASADQVYLLIQAIDRDESPTLMFVQEADGPIHRLVIEDFYDGEAQILLRAGDDIVKALRKAQSDVILR